MDFKELEMIMSLKDFKSFVKFYEIKEEIYTPEWFKIEEIKDEILERYGLDELYGLKVNEEEDDEKEKSYYEDYY